LNIIFLDIDGVLNINIPGREISDGQLIDSDKIALLAKLVKEVDAKIVLHSGWKYWFDEKLNPITTQAKMLKEKLAENNVSISDITPDLASEEIKRTKKFSLVKADEILLWVKNNPGSNWIVIDDLDLHNDVVLSRQIKTDPAVGLQVKDIIMAKSLL